MIRSKILVGVVALLIFPIVLFGQESDLTWLQSHTWVPNETLHTRFDNYSTDDLQRLRTILQSLKDAPSESAWDGYYGAGGGDEVGHASLRINLKGGFARMYIYTCTPELRDFDYGTVVETADTIELVSEIPPGSPRKNNVMKFIKVTWDDRRYLVAETSLAGFAQKAVGVYVQPYGGGGLEWSNFWETGGGPDAKLSGKPHLPARFRNMERSAIRAKVIRVFPRRVFAEFSTPTSFHGGESAVYRIAINAGSNRGIKKGLILRIDGTNEEMTIMRVGPTTSVGVVVRATGDTPGADHCLSDYAKVIKCPAIEVGNGVSSIVGNFFF